MKMKKNTYSALTLVVFTLLFLACATQKKAPKTTTNTTTTNTTPEPLCNVSDKYDEFTKERAVASGPYQIYSEKIDLTRSSLSGYTYSANEAHKSTQLDFYIYARWENGKKIIGLVKYVWQVQNYIEFQNNDPDPKIIFLLSNDEILTIVPSTIESSKLNKLGWVTQRQIFEVNDSTWSKLRDFPPKKFRLRYTINYPSIDVKDFVIDEKYKGQIPRVIKCIDDLNLSK